MKSASFISRQVLSGEYYYLNLTPAKDTPGTVVCGGFEHCDPHYRIARQRFKYHSIEYVVAGQGQLVTAGRTYPLRPGAIYYYSPTTPHEITTDPHRPLVKYFIDFCGPRFARLLNNNPLAQNAPCYFANTARFHELFASLQQSGRDMGPHTPDICGCLLELLILLAADKALSQDDADSPAQQTYQRCRDVIGKRFLELHALNEVAAACHINAPYLCRLFKRYGAESPYQMLVRLKIRHAADLLNGAPSLVKQVAKTTGFSDPYHFSRVFKKIYRVSPRAFLQSAHRARP